MARTTAVTRPARQLVVWLHVASSVAWMSQALALLALLGAGGAGPWAAAYLDSHVLVYCANVSAFTGYLLAAATPWGGLKHWWVAVKLALTTGQLYVGIFVLSGALHAAVAGTADPAPVAAGAALMASALGFQTWLSVAKPWGRTPLPGAAERGSTAPGWVFVAGVVAPLADTAFGLLGSRPLPVLSIVVLTTAVVAARLRRRADRRPPPGRPRARAVA